MSEFFNLSPLNALNPSDEFLVVRSAVGRRAAVSLLNLSADSITETSVTPPTSPDKLFWNQINTSGALLDQWRRIAADRWISQESYQIDSYLNDLNGNTSFVNPSPIPGAEFFIDRFSVRALLDDSMSGTNRYDFRLNLVNSLEAEVQLFLLRAEGIRAKGSLIELSESVNSIQSSSNALALVFRTTRSGSQKLKFLSQSAILRRVYPNAS